jgi:hypothetical protein
MSNRGSEASRTSHDLCIVMLTEGTHYLSVSLQLTQSRLWLCSMIYEH